MNIPIVFSFNNNYCVKAGVAITSLLSNANSNISYDIYILYSSSRLSNDNKVLINRLSEEFNNCEISFIDVKGAFGNEYEVRNVTIDSYYRLLIPELLHQIPKVIYCDVDTIIDRDITDIFTLDISKYLIAGVKEFPSSCKKSIARYLTNISINPREYINAGVLIFNNAMINRNPNYNSIVMNMRGQKFRFQDQDIINIIFKGRICFLPSSFNYSSGSIEQCIKIKDPHIIHFILKKPWDQPKVFGDLWWQYYKNSIFYDEDYYQTYLVQNSIDIDRHIRIGRILKKFGLYRILDWLN
ncbi:glycosyltransferase family 8 protein [Saccharicrinis aurantiacus]|uniref:glycosyltransferase family 8 protein n=1 Tax=Saccharicrinis aurantiacus TaxID=1849719 RepID=UPI00249051BF|nr:glycosyltransferase family 8 protein [Saccharicrinis aurantiacus]